MKSIFACICNENDLKVMKFKNKVIKLGVGVIITIVSNAWLGGLKMGTYAYKGEGKGQILEIFLRTY